jgi:TonB family protein
MHPTEWIKSPMFDYDARLRTYLKQLVWVGVLLSAACSGASSHPPENGAEDWTTGREALQSIVQSAKQWSPDAEVIRLYSGICKKAPHEGVCDEWRAVMVSPSRKQSTGFYWLRGGITHGEVNDYEPKDRQPPIDVTKIQADSDAAFRVAKEHGGKPLLEANPEMEIRYAMMLDKKAVQLMWLVVYDIKGSDFASAKLQVVINAETGEFNSSPASSPRYLTVCSANHAPPCATAPRAIDHPNPEYSEEARHAKIEGTVVLGTIVGADGHTHDIYVATSLGHGLDEQAIKAVRQWIFEPGVSGGVPVPVLINVKVDFRLH